jgi:hypothetical protein
VVDDTTRVDYTDSRTHAEYLAERRAGGEVIEREQGAWYQRGVFGLHVPRHCRACDEQCCTLRSHTKES